MQTVPKRILLIYFVLIEFFHQTLSEKILPYGRKPIELTVNNANEISSYIFKFITQTDLLQGDGILIKFPVQIVIDTTKLVGNYISGQTFNLETGLWESLLSNLSISYQGSSVGFLITVPDMKAGIYKIQIDKITNPSSQVGTGMFSIQTRRFAAYVLDYNLLDDNDAFGQVGIIQAAPTTLVINSVTQTNTQINTISDYTIQFTTSIIVPIGGFIVISLENTSMNFLSDSTFSSVSIPTGVFRSQNNNLLFIEQFTTSIAAGTSINVVITRILNPVSKGLVNNLLIQTWLDGAFTILEQKIFDLEVLIQPGTFTQIQKQAFGQFFVKAPIYPLTPNEVVQHELSFITSNPIPQNGQIIIRYFITPPVNPLKFSLRVISGLQDISSDQTTGVVNIKLVGTDIVITQFQAISGQKLIKIAFEVNHGNITPLTTFKIQSYYTSDTSRIIDIIDSATNLQTLSIPQTPVAINSIAFSQQLSGAVNTVLIQIGTNIPSNSELWVWFPEGFMIDRNTCSIISPIMQNCQTVPVVGYEDIAIIVLGAATVTSPITISINVQNNLSAFQNYPIGISIVFSVGKVIQNHSTMYYSVVAPGISGIAPKSAGFTVSQLSLDCQQYSMMKFFFQANEDLPQSQWLSDYTQQTSRILLKFPIFDSTLAAAFSSDLGLTNLYSLSDFPCYGIQSIFPLTSDSDLLCQLLTKPADVTSTNPVVVQITNYKMIPANSQVEFHFPNFRNPSQTINIIPIVLEIYKTNYRQEYQLFKDTINLPICNPSTASQNPKNPLNAAPIFNPAGVSQISTTSIFYTPGTNKNLSPLDSFVFSFPQLQQTSPMQYILPKTGLFCYIGVGSTISIPCKTYPKSGWVLFFVNSAIAQNVEITFYLTGIKNPSFASDFQGTLKTLSIKGNMIIEVGVFSAFKVFNSGALNSAKVTCEYFESLRTDVNYDFLFSFNDDVPEGGNVDLIFPPNFFDLSRDTSSDPDIPQAVLEVFFGIESQDSLPLTDDSHKQISVNIYTINGVKKIPAKQLIYLRMRHIRNPPIEGITNFFGIKSKNQEDLTIDYDRSIRTVTILRQLPTGIVNFNYFMVTPDNGNPTTAASDEVSNFPGTYTVSFYPNYDIPPLGMIILQFPNDFSKSYFLDDPNIRCNVSGAIKTYKSCQLDPSSTVATIIVKLDDYLYVVDGMDPVIISIPHIKNIGPELSTGVVVVKTQYDQIVLDESGTTVTNRKANTGVTAKILNVKSFLYSPKNEGQASTYTVELYPNYSFDGDTWILFEFSYDYSRELGESVQCQSSDLQNSVNSPIQCLVGDWQIQMKNLKAFTSTQTTVIKIDLIGIINPKKDSLPNIKCFIMENDIHAQSYAQNIATAIPTISAPAILFMKDLTIGSSNTRTNTDYQFFLQFGSDAQFDITSIQFQQGYDLSNLWVSKQLTFSPAGASTMTIAPIGNNIQINQATNVLANSQINIKMTAIPNPYDEGLQPGYPTVSLFNTPTFEIVQQTFNNLNNFLTPDFTHNGPLIIVNDDNPQIYVEAGVWSLDINVKIAAAQLTDLVISPIILPAFSNFVQFRPIKILAGKTSTTFQIGVSSQIQIQQLFVEWDKSLAPPAFISVRPVVINFQRQKNVQIIIDTIGSVPSGGRSNPIQVQLTNAPFDNLYINVRILGTIPQYLTVYPTELSFNQGNLVNYFWVSVGPYTQGTSGQIIFFLTSDGTVNDQLTLISTFKLQNRLQNFIISKPDSSAPLVYNANNVVKADGFYFTIQVSTPSTIYIFAAKKMSKRITLAQLKAKLYPTSYFGSPYIIAEYTQKNDQNQYSFTVQGLPSNFDFVAHIYVEDYNGNQSASPLDFNSRTLGGSVPTNTSKKPEDLKWVNNITDTVMGQISSSYAYITNLGLLYPGQIYAVVLTNPRYTYPNLDTAVEGSIRYLSTSSHTCTQMSLNVLSIQCSLNGIQFPDSSRTDYLTFSSPGIPNAYQIYQGLDQDNLTPNSIASGSFPSEIPWILKISNLQPNTEYVIYYVGVHTEGINYTLMDDQDIRQITFKTIDSELVSQNSSHLLHPKINLIIGIFIAVLY